MKNAVNEIMNKVYVFGGELKTLAQIKKEMEDEGRHPKMIDWYLFCIENQEWKREREKK